MKVIYIADDGTQFATEAECYEYEEARAARNLECFDCWGSLIRPSDEDFDVNNVIVIHCTDVQSVAALLHVFKEDEFVEPMFFHELQEDLSLGVGMWFCWDEVNEGYNVIDPNQICFLYKLINR